MIEWLDQGKCQLKGPMDPNYFYPTVEDKNGDEDSKNLEALEAQRAKFCHGIDDKIPCKVRNVCLDYAIATNQYGVWGGTTKQERVRLRKRRAAKKAA